jgi:hypothetical protein
MLWRPLWSSLGESKKKWGAASIGRKMNWAEVDPIFAQNFIQNKFMFG